MARKNRRKNKRSKRDVVTPTESLCPEAQEELAALEAIYVNEFTLDDTGMGFSLKVLPHPGEAEANFISITLSVRCTSDYPQVPPEISIEQKEGLTEDQSSELLDLLTDSAADFVSLKEVYLFSLVIVCQESLQTWNEMARKEADQGASLWDAMQRRNKEEASFRVENTWNFGGSLFTVDEQGGIPDDSFQSQPDMALTRVKMERENADKKERETQPFMSRNRAYEMPSTSPTHKNLSQLKPTRIRGDGVHRITEEPTTPGARSSMSQNLMSLVQTMVEKVVPLPSAFLKYLGLSSPENVDDQDLEEDDICEADKVRRDLFMGYLLKLVTSGNTGRMPVHSLPILSAHLQSKNLLPRWVQWIVTQRPALFNRAFSKLFAQEIGETDRSSSKDPQPNDVLQQFWSPHFLSNAERMERHINSRYFTDFDEGKRLGRGGFGVVVSATNRLDGRQYAIKKIKILHSAASYYSRMMREVATLSRLQHPNVVRYFQAWFEPWYDDGNFSSDGDESEELDAWQGALLTGRESSNNPRSLQTVVEDSDTYASASFAPSSPKLRQGLMSTNEASVFDFASKSQSTVELPSGYSSSTGTSLQSKRGHQTLYIQMELCSRTLQQVLEEDGIEDEDQRWEVLRQILLGLGYIHSLRIIHRDLKPANIFYSASGEIKLGDFGLAKFTAPTGEVHPEEAHGTPAPSAMSHTDETGVCGTSFYIAPEVANNWASYGFKVDMYSLGVVVFELWHKFATGMERSVILKNLQEKGIVPGAWEQQHPKVAELIRWLMSVNPLDRPTPREVLQSQYLPPRVEDDQIRDLMRSIHTNMETYDRVVDGVFKSATSRQSDIDVLAQDLSGAPISTLDIDVHVQERVSRVVKQVFSCHGAIQMASSEVKWLACFGKVGLCHSRVPQDAVRVLSFAGDVYALKYDLRCPFVEWLVDQALSNEAYLHHFGTTRAIEGFRRYDISTVYRQGRGVTLTRAHLQADLDFVTPLAPHPSSKMLKENKVVLHKVLSEQLLAEAEIVKAVFEAVSCFKIEADHTFEVRLSHATLLVATLKQIGIPHDKQCQVMDVMSMAAKISAGHASRTEAWDPVQKSLEGLGLPSSIIRHCRRYFTKIAGNPDAVLPQLRSALLGEGQVTSSPAVVWCLEELDVLTSFLQTWNILSHQVVIEPLMKPEADYFSGIFFQIHMVQRGSGRSFLVAVGGRYDNLLGQLWNSQGHSSGAICNFGGVGATLNLDPFVRAEMEASACVSESFTTDVLVCFRGGGASSLETRMDLVSRLWDVGIKAGMLHKVAASMTEHYEHAVSKGIRWLVTIDEQKLSSSETVRVKNLDRKIEEDVPFKEVPQYILKKMAGSTQRTSSTK